MSLPEVRLVLARHHAAEAGRMALSGELQSLAAAAAMGSKDAAKEMAEVLGDLREIANPGAQADDAAARPALGPALAEAFAALGIPASNN